MAVTQIGYLGGVGPVFVDDSPGGGKKILLQGQGSPSAGLYAKQSGYATNIGLNASDYVLGAYADNQRVSDIPAFVQPTGGPNFSGFDSNVSAMVSATTIPGGGSTTTPTTGGGTTTTTGGGTTTTTGGGTVVTTTDTVYKAPTITEQVSTFASNYWWLILLILGFVLWKPFIAPALGMGGKRKRSYR